MSIIGGGGYLRTGPCELGIPAGKKRGFTVEELRPNTLQGQQQQHCQLNSLMNADSTLTGSTVCSPGDNNGGRLD